MTIEAITTAALALPPESRAALADTLLASLDEEVAKLTYAEEWEAEIEDRIAAYERGELKAIPLEQVMQSLESPRHEG